jgi:hypothetical protein
MSIRRRGIARLELLAVIAIVAVAVMLVLGIFSFWRRSLGPVHRQTVHPAAHVTTPPRRLGPGYNRRLPGLDTSGFGIVKSNASTWGPDATLTEIGEIWRGARDRAMEQIDRRTADAARRPGDRLVDMVVKATIYNYDGKPEKAYELLEQVRSQMQEDDEISRNALATLIYYQGVCAMRWGENDNCIMCRGESSCILPISPAAVHLNTKGSRLAIGHFTEYLAQFPDDLEIRWLLNLAHMTLGEYPDRVDPRYVLDLSRFFHSEFDIGKFRDIGHLVGVNRYNQAGGAIMEDFDNDGLFDLAVTNWNATQSMSYYRNMGDSTFEDRSKEAEVTDQLGGLVCYQADYDNDGWMDIFIARGAWLPGEVRPTLLHNDGKGKFHDVTKEAGLLAAINSNSAAWADYDNDGQIDLFIGCERQHNRLYRNKGNGTFEEVAESAGVQGEPARFCKGCTWIDYDNDGYPDLFLNNLNDDARLYHNNRTGGFTEETLSMEINGPHYGFSCWAWDYDNDGWLDIFATCYDRTLGAVVNGLIGQHHNCYSNRLYRNNAGKAFVDMTEQAGLNMVFSTMGSNFSDFDNDGFLDMYLGTGEPDIATLIPNRMFRNVDGRRFSEITASSGTGHLQKGHGVACGDWDRDGDVDLFVEIGGVTNGDRYHNVLFENPGQGNHWLSVKLVGKKTNRAAIGARIKVVTAGDEPRTVYRHVSSGSSFGANPLEQTIGLAKATRVAQLEIHWPTSGTTQVLRDIAADQAIEVTEFASTYRPLNLKPILTSVLP